MSLLLLLVPFALALVVLSVLGFAGFGPLTDDRRADRDGIVGAVGPAVGLLLGLGLIAGAVLASVALGFGGDADGDGADDEQGPRPRSSRPRRAATAPSATAPSTGAAESSAPPAGAGKTRRVATLGPHVIIGADDGEGFPESYGVADRLQPGTVLSVIAHGFEPFEPGTAEQCAPTISARCFNQIPVQFDEDGVARFQYLVSPDFQNGAAPAGRCRVGTAPCTIVVRSIDRERWGQLQTIFGEAAPPPGRITVTPADGLSLDGQTVTVTVRDYPPGATVRAMLCAAPAATLDRCGRPGPEAPLVVGPNGTGSTELLIEPGDVGAARASCTRGSDCGIAVASRDVFTRAPAVPISFAGRAGADYDPTRLALGLAGAAILLADRGVARLPYGLVRGRRGGGAGDRRRRVRRPRRDHRRAPSRGRRARRRVARTCSSVRGDVRRGEVRRGPAPCAR